ncbi:MAG: Lrp/AsnC family transcriptional regulator [Paludibacteraceae bacterium]|jgi:Lrp/AsnC family leucine-responsive transcriptional regulator|nr:Lrp/AsnC family transcriptional regulator [Paludibacteraceae bacterium]
MEAKIDETDRQLLILLQQNSNITIKELAQKVSLSPTPVFERIKRLERDGFISKYVAVLNAEKLSQGFIVFCYVRLKQHSKQNGNDFIAAIQRFPQITECYNISGDYDFMLKIYVKDMRQYQDLVLNQLGEIDSIGSLKSIFAMCEIMNKHGIPV